jgi:hypothetical protein
LFHFHGAIISNRVKDAYNLGKYCRLNANGLRKRYRKKNPVCNSDGSFIWLPFLRSVLWFSQGTKEPRFSWVWTEGAQAVWFFRRHKGLFSDLDLVRFSTVWIWFSGLDFSVFLRFGSCVFLGSVGFS